MIHEYALEPELLLNAEACEFLASHFGIPRGRLVSEFPEHWLDLIWSTLSDARPVAKHRITEALSRLRSRMMPRSCQWEDDGGWLAQAEHEHKTRPFRAILATQNPSHRQYVLGRNDLTENNALWNVDVTRPVKRTATDMAFCAKGLLNSAQEILFVDPHFSPEAARFRKPMEAFLDVLARRDHTMKILRVEIHIEAKATADFIREECEGRFAAIVPAHLPVTLVRWQSHYEFHNRYILTNRGGLLFAQGLDEGLGHDDVTILSDTGYRQRWGQFQKPTAPFQFVDEFRIVGRKPQGE